MQVDELWWEDDTLCIRTKDGEVLKFLGANVKNVDYHLEDDENVTVTSVPLTCERFKL